jgi:hypothetical protein
MKKLILISLVALFSIKIQAQMNEKMAMKETHINFKKEHLYFIISGKIEINGHTFVNDTCKQPIYYYATIKEVKIINPEAKIEYVFRDCGEKDCDIIHLDIVSDTRIVKYPFKSTNYGQSTLENIIINR